MLIPVNRLPTNFKPYPFKSFKLKGITLQQAIDLGADPSLTDIQKLIQELASDEIDASLLVPIDLKYLVSMLSFHAFPKQSWTLNLTCPHCKHAHKRTVGIKDFPPIPSLEDSDPYPLTIDDGRHTYALGYMSVASLEKMLAETKGKVATGEDVPLKERIRYVEPYILSVDGKPDNIHETLMSLDDFGVLGVMTMAIQKYFVEDTYAEFECPKCKKKYEVPMSAVEVTQYTPFPDKETASGYKVNFRL